MLIEDDCREYVDNNYLKDASHLTAIILHFSSGKIVQNKFRKMFSKFKIEKSHYSTNTMRRMPQLHKLDFKASGELKVKSFKRKKVRKSNLKFLLYSLCCAGGLKNKFKIKRVYSVHSKTDRSQLLTIACSQEHEKGNKMMAQAETPKLKLSRSKG